MSIDLAAYGSSKLVISLIISLKLTFPNENGKATSDGTCFFICTILGWFSTFLLYLTSGHDEG